jgi:F0F1-type ATP synthase epsilon subunit
VPAASETLHLVVRTPRETLIELEAGSLRVPTDSGQVGVRPRAEPALLAVEPGLVLVRQGKVTVFVATAGGLLRCERRRAVLLTPLAVSGEDARSVRLRLEAELAGPNAELQLRHAIRRLEAGIVGEIRQRSGAAPLPSGSTR